MCTFCLSKIWIHSPYSEKHLINLNMRWFICCGENAFQSSFIGTSAKKITSSIWMVEMSHNLVFSKLWVNSSISTKTICAYVKKTYKDIFQYVYSYTFPEIYTMLDKHGIDLKSNFHILFKTYKDKQTLRKQQLAKQPINYTVEHLETWEFEPKPVLRFDEFTDEEERELKKKTESEELLKNKQQKKRQQNKLKKLNKISLRKVKCGKN